MKLAALAAALQQQIDAAGPAPNLGALREASFEEATLVFLIQRQNPFNAAGPSGLRYSHLQDYIDTRRGRSTLPPLLAELFELVVYQTATLPPLCFGLNGCGNLITAAPSCRAG